MKNKVSKCGLSGLCTGAAYLLISVQAGTVPLLPANAESALQPVFNDSLPLPELNLFQLDRPVKNAQTHKIASPPRNINAGTLLPPGNISKDAGRLSASDDQSEDSDLVRHQTQTKPAAVSTASDPIDRPALREAIPTVPIPAQSTTQQPLRANEPAASSSSAAIHGKLPYGNQTATQDLLQTTESLANDKSKAPLIKTVIETTAATSTANSNAKPTITAPVAQSPSTAIDQIQAEMSKPAADPDCDKTASTGTTDPVETSQEQSGSDEGKSVAMLSPDLAASTPAEGIIVIDNDEESEQAMTLEVEEMQTDAAGSKIKVGARFPIVVTSEITSKTAKAGDAINARLKFDLKIKDKLIAEKGSVVRGHINYALKARTPMASLVSANRWYKDSGCLGVAFDEIINGKGEHIPLVAEPSKQALYVKNKGEGRELGINHKGQITGPWSQQLKYKAVRVGLNFAMAPAGVFSFGAMPVALGVIGAANPSFAFMKPVGTNVRHRRIKGFFWGALSGVPGSWLIEDTTVKGQEAVIKPGDEFYAEMRKEFTGEPAPEAQVASDADMQVQGEVIKRNKKRGKKDKS